LLLVTLLVFGSVSDYLGRRRVVLAGLAMAAGATGLFLAAHGVGLLFAARALHGAAVGTATSALGAALIDLQPEAAPWGGTSGSMHGWFPAVVTGPLRCTASGGDQVVKGVR
jgi:MFS family permease